MQARDIMTRTVGTVTATTTIHDAATLLTSNGFTALPVVDEGFPHDPRFHCSDEGAVHSIHQGVS